MYDESALSIDQDTI